MENLKNLVLIGAEKCVTKNLIGENEKLTNKGKDKHEDDDSLLHDLNSHVQCLYKISISYLQ